MFTTVEYDSKTTKLLPKPTCRRTKRTNITTKCLVSQFAVLLWGSRLHGLVLHRFLARISVRIFCTDFLHGFFARIFARIFCTDFLHRFFARFLPDIFARISARIVCKNCLYRCLHGFLHGFLWHLLGSVKISLRKSPEKFTMLWGPFGEGVREAGG